MSVAPSSCYQLVPQVLRTRGLGASDINTFSFPPQHRFLPCENRSKAVEQVKTAFSKVSLGGGRGGSGNTTAVHSPGGRGCQMLQTRSPRGSVRTQQMA